jgi:hypothetical protein
LISKQLSAVEVLAPLTSEFEQKTTNHFDTFPFPPTAGYVNSPGSKLQTPPIEEASKLPILQTCSPQRVKIRSQVLRTPVLVKHCTDDDVPQAGLMQ